MADRDDSAVRYFEQLDYAYDRHSNPAMSEPVVPSARVVAPLWRRLLAMLRRRLRPRCAMCAQFGPGMSRTTLRMFHRVHCDIERLSETAQAIARDGEERARREAAEKRRYVAGRGLSIVIDGDLNN
jgi:hypothetical protein